MALCIRLSLGGFLKGASILAYRITKNTIIKNRAHCNQVAGVKGRLVTFLN